MRVYEHLGEKVAEDPRRAKEYKEGVLEGLGFGSDGGTEKYPGLNDQERAAARET